MKSGLKNGLKKRFGSKEKGLKTNGLKAKGLRNADDPVESGEMNIGANGEGKAREMIKGEKKGLKAKVCDEKADEGTKLKPPPGKNPEFGRWGKFDPP